MSNEATRVEPPPVPTNEQSAHDLVIEDLRRTGSPSLGTVVNVIEDMAARKLMGLRKYNTILQPHNGRDSLVDAYQESLDLMAYLRNEINKRGDESLRVVYSHALHVALALRLEIDRCAASA